MSESYRRHQAFSHGASVVKVTRPDGTVEYEEPYTNEQLLAIDAKAAKQPRTWNEVNSTGGGGADRHFIR